MFFQNKTVWLAISVVTALVTASHALAFTGPSQAPPGGGGLLAASSTTRSLEVATTTVYSVQSKLLFQTLGGSNQHILFSPNGNVGIATTTPAEKLTVVGNIQTTGSFIGALSGNLSAANVTGPSAFGSNYGTYSYAFPGALAIGTSTTTGLPTEGLYVKGNVGIGTTAPAEKLEVIGNIISKGTSWTLRTSAADNGWLGVTYGNGLFVAVANTGTGNRVMTSGKTELNALSHNNIYQGGLSVMGGNVGIGTTSPDEKFEVEWIADGTDVEIGRGTTDIDVTFLTLRSPNGTKYYITVSDAGALSASTTKP